MIKCTLVSAIVVIGCCITSSQAIELIEMNDKNQNVLLIPLAKALEEVQSAYTNEFNFDSVKAVELFLSCCTYVNDVMSKSSDDAYEELASQIKQIMADPTIATACSTTQEEIKEAGLAGLDNDFIPKKHDYLSNRKTEKLLRMKNAVEESPSLSAVFGKLLHKRISDLAEASLKEAVETIEMFFDDRVKRGFFDIDAFKYKGTCKIQKVQPICKLVRRCSDEEVSAISQDLADFVEIVKANDEANLVKHQEASGVTIDDVKTQCASMKDNFGNLLRPIEKIQRWVADGLMSEEMFQGHLKTDRDLAFYNELSKLCKLVQSASNGLPSSATSAR